MGAKGFLNEDGSESDAALVEDSDDCSEGAKKKKLSLDIQLKKFNLASNDSYVRQEKVPLVDVEDDDELPFWWFRRRFDCTHFFF